nr:S41 family peptidase [Paraburkholderia youngii]
MFSARFDRAGLVTQSLQDWLAARDLYGAYLTPADYARYRETQRVDYAGIGLILTREKDGTTRCEPLADSPAERAGIRRGDQLIAVDGEPVRGRALPALAAHAAGEIGTPVTLDLVDATGVPRRVTPVRAALHDVSVSTSTVNGARIVRITRFAPDTPNALAFALQQWPAHEPVIVDLRGCGGGDFYAAVDSAMLFLAVGETIVTVDGRSGSRSYVATARRPLPAQPVWLWQDDGTASAAELFVAALVEHGRARSVGLSTAGKGSRQEILQLADGAALLLTTGYLRTPRGQPFEGVGLAPQVPLAAAHAGTDDYLRASGSVADSSRMRAATRREPSVPPRGRTSKDTRHER